MRGIHITVRDFYTNKVINDEYGPGGGPFEDSRIKNGKIMWFRPSKYMHLKYVPGEENESGYEPFKKNFEFDIDYYPDKRAWYF